MCELCNIQDETGLSDETIMRIVKVVEAAEESHLQQTVLSMMYVLNIDELTITSEEARRAAEDMEFKGVSVKENIAADWSAMTYTIEREKEENDSNTLRPLKEGEVSANNELAQLFNALGLEF